MAGGRTPADADDARGLISAARSEAEARDRQTAATEQAAAARDRSARTKLQVALAAALTLGAAAVGISFYAATTSAERVAQEVAPQVSEAQITDARETRAVNARRLLGAANAELERRGLPVVTDPGPGAGADQLQTAATAAQVLALLPESATEDLEGDPALVVLLNPDGTVGTSPPAAPEVEPGGG